MTGRSLVIACFGVAVSMAAAAADAPSSVVVVPLKPARQRPPAADGTQRQESGLRREIRRKLEAALASQARVVPVSAYRNAASAAGIEERASASPAHAVALGNKVGATHVYIVAWSVAPEEADGARNWHFFATLSAVDVASGETIFSRKYKILEKDKDAKIQAMAKDLIAATSSGGGNDSSPRNLPVVEASPDESSEEADSPPAPKVAASKPKRAETKPPAKERPSRRAAEPKAAAVSRPPAETSSDPSLAEREPTPEPEPAASAGPTRIARSGVDVAAVEEPSTEPEPVPIAARKSKAAKPSPTPSARTAAVSKEPPRSPVAAEAPSDESPSAGPKAIEAASDNPPPTETAAVTPARATETNPVVEPAAPLDRKGTLPVSLVSGSRTDSAADGGGLTNGPTFLASADASGGADSELGLSTTAPPARRERDPWRPALHVSLGALAVQRSASIDLSPLRYSAPLTCADLRVEVYPLAFASRRAWYESLGLYGEGQYTRSQTVVDEVSRQTVSSNLMMARAGAVYRLLVWEGESSPSLFGRLGYSGLMFPLRSGRFPGTRYHGPELGAGLGMPLFSGLGAILDLGVSPYILPTGKLHRLGRRQSAYRLRAELGVRYNLDIVEVALLGRFEQYTSAYRGDTNLQDSLAQFTDVTLTDRMLGAAITVGTTF